jgi:hypothetical protein
MRAEDVAQGRPPTNGQVDKPITYSKTDHLPDKVHVRIVFEGLLWFVFHGTDECQVGVVNTTHGPDPHPARHDLDIRVWTRDRRKPAPCDLMDRFHIGNPKSVTNIQIDVNKPAPSSEGVKCYEPNVVSSGAMAYDEKDWRWLIDFERSPLYPKGIRLDESKINPGISINHGVFYTLSTSTYEFDFVPDNLKDDAKDSIKHGTYVALLAAADIELQKDGDVTLVIRRAFPSTSLFLPLRYSDSVRYQIDIRNICMVDGKPCPPKKADSESDFYLYNETFTRPVGAPLYTLQKRPPAAGLAGSYRFPSDVCAYPVDRGQTESTNEAPCGPVTAGGGGGG